MSKRYFVDCQNEKGERRRFFYFGQPLAESNSAPNEMPVIAEGQYYDYWDESVPTIVIDQQWFDAVLECHAYDAEHGVFVAIDKNHQLAYGDRDAEALGFATLELRGQAPERVLWVVMKKWTDDGAATAARGGLPYTSAAPMDTPHPALGVQPWMPTVAICGSPYMRNVGPYVAMTAGGKGRKRQEDEMKRLFAVLKLGDNATEDQVLERIAPLNVRAQAFTAMATGAGLTEAATGEQVVAAIAAGAVRPFALAVDLAADAKADEVLAKVKAFGLAAKAAGEQATNVANLQVRLDEQDAKALKKSAEQYLAGEPLKAFCLDVDKDLAGAKKTFAMLSNILPKLPLGAAADGGSAPAGAQTFTADEIALCMQIHGFTAAKAQEFLSKHAPKTA
jgi:hypothetical protein